MLRKHVCFHHRLHPALFISFTRLSLLFRLPFSSSSSSPIYALAKWHATTATITSATLCLCRARGVRYSVRRGGGRLSLSPISPDLIVRPQCVLKSANHLVARRPYIQKQLLLCARALLFAKKSIFEFVLLKKKDFSICFSPLRSFFDDGSIVGESGIKRNSSPP